MGRKMSALILIFITIVLAISGQLAMKKGMNNIGEISIKDFFSQKLFTIVFEKFVFVGILLYAISAIFWLATLSQEELSFAYPIISIGYIITAILSKILFKEHLTMFRIIGIILIVAGVYFVVMKW